MILDSILARAGAAQIPRQLPQSGLISLHFTRWERFQILRIYERVKISTRQRLNEIVRQGFTPFERVDGDIFSSLTKEATPVNMSG